MLRSARVPGCAGVLAALLVATAPTRAAWTDVSASSASGALPERGQHALECTIDGTLYVFGGARRVVIDGARRFELLGDFWRLRRGGTFEDLTAATDCPIPPTIEPHFASDAEGRVYEFGGIQESLSGWFSHRLYRFDPASGAWSDLTPDDSLAAPPGREDHGFVGDWKRDALWVFGGVTQSEDLLNDLWRYDVARGGWERVDPAPSSPVPSGRELYDLVWDGGDALYVFGGWDPAVGYLNDFWRYDIERRTWTDLTDVSGSRAISPRSYVGMCADANGIVWLAGGYAAPRAVGGFWRYDPLDGRWRDLTDRAPEELLPRATYNLVCSPVEHAIYAFGGLLSPMDSPDPVYANDLWRFPLRPEVHASTLLPTTISASSQAVHATIEASSMSGRPLTYAWTMDGAALPLLDVVDEVDVGPLCAGTHTLHVDVRDGVIVEPVEWTWTVPGPDAATLRVTPSIIRGSQQVASVELCGPFNGGQDVHVELIGPRGRCLFTLRGTSGMSMPLDTSDLPAGIYFVRALVGREERSARIVLSR